MALANVKAEKKKIKSFFTRTSTFITTNQADWTDKKIADLKARFEKFDEFYNTFEKLQAQCSSLDPKESEETLEKEFEEFETKFFDISASISLILKNYSGASQISAKSHDPLNTNEVGDRMKEQIARIDFFFDSGYNNNLMELECRLDQLSLSWNRFESALNGNTADIEDQYFMVYSKIKKFLTEKTTPTQTTDSLSSTPLATQSIKLPVINLPQFNGNYLDWLKFRDLFHSLIHISALPKIQKFHYLKTSLVNEAAQVIDSLDVTEENYEIAWNLVKERFENKRILIRNHVNAILELSCLTRESPTALRDLIDTVNKHLRALKTLKQPVDQWDTLIVQIVTLRLDNQTKREWEMSNTTDEPSTFEQLMKFLKNRCNYLETLYSGKLQERKLESKAYNFAKKPLNKQGQTHCNVTTNSNKKLCNFCKGTHLIFKCTAFRELPVKNRTFEIEKMKLCTNCFRSGHKANDCKSSSCRVCNQNHNTLLHNDSSAHIQPQQSTSAQQNSSAFTAQISSKRALIPTAMVRVYDANGCVHELRALLDSGSESNFMTADACKRLQIKTVPTSHSIFGIHQRSIDINERVTLTIHSRINEFSATISCLILQRITGNLPSDYIPKSQLQIPASLALADPNFNESKPIDMLIGSGLFWELFTKEPQIRLGRNKPILQNTVLGWIIGGPISTNRVENHSCLLTTIESQMQRFWEVEELRDCVILSDEERACEQHFLDNYSRNSDGRYVVKLPFKENAKPLGGSRSIAEKRFLLLERKLNKDNELKHQYCEFMSEYENLNHMKLVNSVSNSESKREFYMPHHAVIREQSTTTKVRVVYDASAKSTTGVSLNENLMVGPTIQPDLFSTINRFRMHRFVLTGDIAKMYRQILVAEEDQEFQKILWRSDPAEPLQTFRLSTVTYGTASAPYLAIRCLKQIAIDEESHFPLARSVIENDFYVDDMLTGANTVTELKEIREQVTNCLLQGGFELRKWTSNSVDVLPDNYTTENSLINFDKEQQIKTLGLSWNFNEDALMYEVTPIDYSAEVTKRFVLSTISKLFDPLGLVGPILTAKQIMQQLWSLKVDWNDPLPPQLHAAWNKFTTDLPTLRSLRIPRHVSPGASNYPFEIHGFCHASEVAYGACVYIRTKDQAGNFYVHLLCAKSRIAPLKTLSIPRLELCSAILLAKLIRKVTKALRSETERIYLWTDSTIVLSWLSAPPNTWKIFIAHRVAEISKLTSLGSWAHVSSENNPADIISRGTTPSNLINLTLWWYGPVFLKQNQKDWQPQPVLRETNLEQRRNVTLTTLPLATNPLINSFLNCSTWSKLRRTMCYVLRFIQNCKYPKDERLTQQLFPSELERGVSTIIKIIQQTEFSPEIHQLRKTGALEKSNRLIALTPFIDHNGLLRVGGRLANSDISHDRKHPVILPKNNHITDLIIRYEHERHLHAGNQATLAAIRENYWPIAGRNQVKKVLQKCLKCIKYKPKLMQNIMGNLPPYRVTISRPFLNCGVDYAGPILIRESGGRNRRMIKAYIALFICFATKAIHIELVGNLTTESFLGALKRFTSRRGHILNLYSDNGTNFVGASNELRQLFQSQQFQTKVIDSLSNDQINWHFIPARSPHFGGLWEAGIKSTKSHLKKVLENASLTFEEMYTLLVRIEGCLNSRPLVPLSEDPKDLSALTPGHFLIGTSITSIIDQNYVDTKSNRLSRWQRIDQLHQQFWRRWSKEYLPILQERVKWRTRREELCIPDAMVLIHEDNIPPQRWRLGRILECHSGNDGVTRVVTVKTSSGPIKRCINKICVLPTDK